MLSNSVKKQTIISRHKHITIGLTCSIRTDIW